MFQSKLLKSFILGLSLSVVLSAAAYAQSENDQELKIQIEQVGGGNDSIMQIAPDTPVTSEPIGDAMYQKQSEIDKVLFEDSKDEIVQRGITVTHTSAANEYVEIGITPFNDENAAFLSEILGNDKIKIVEGFQAIPYSDGAAGSEELMYATGAPAEDANIVLAQDDVKVVSATVETVSAPADTAPSAALIAGIAAAVLAVIGGILVMKRRMKAVR